MIFISLRLIERSSPEDTPPLPPPHLSFLVTHRRKLETPVHTNDKKRISKSRFVRVDRGGPVDPPTIQNRRSKRTYDYYTTPMISHCIRIYQIDVDLLDDVDLLVIYLLDRRPRYSYFRLRMQL